MESRGAANVRATADVLDLDFRHVVVGDRHLMPAQRANLRRSQADVFYESIVAMHENSLADATANPPTPALARSVVRGNPRY
jgi:hypothetical protein